MIRNHRFVERDQGLVLSAILITILLIGSACSLFAPVTPSNTAPTQETPKDELFSPQPEPTSTIKLATPTSYTITPLHQWAVSAADEKTSEEASYAIGEPDSQDCELNPRESVWVYQSDSPLDSTNYLQLFFVEPTLPSEVNIHLAYYHSAIAQVSLIDLQGQPHKIYESSPKGLSECPFVLSIEAKNVAVPVYAVRIDVETTDPENFGLTAIDAVELVGEPLAEPQPTPIATPYLTMSSLGLNAANIQEGYVHFEVIDNHSGTTISITECNVFSFNLTESERTIKIFSCDDQTEIWLYVPLSLEIGSIPLNSYPNYPSARLFIEGVYIPAMEGELWIDQVSNTNLTGVLDFKGFNPDNQADYYRVVAVFNQIPLNDEAAQQPGDMITQWSEKATTSSEHSEDENAAAQALGASDTWENCETATTTWKPAGTDTQPWIELYFQTPVDPKALNILFSGNPESFTTVNLLSETDRFPLDMETARVLEGCPRALTFNPIIDPPRNIIGVHITLDAENSQDTFGVDAVQLIGVILD